MTKSMTVEKVLTRLEKSIKQHVFKPTVDQCYNQTSTEVWYTIIEKVSSEVYDGVGKEMHRQP